MFGLVKEGSLICSDVSMEISGNIIHIKGVIANKK